MNALLLIKQGILEEDLKKVKEGYKLLTGEDLSKPTPKKRGRPKKGPIEPQIENVDETPQEPQNAVSDESVQPQEEFAVNHKAAARMEPLIRKNRKNLFVDDGKIAANESVKVNPTLGTQTFTQRPKPKKKVKVTCSKCNRTELVWPAFAPAKIGDDEARYICNRCI